MTEDYRSREEQWDEQWPSSEEEARARSASDDVTSLDEMSGFPETVGTTDPLAAARDAEPYMPPTDPPVLPGGTEGIHVATGFGISAEEEAATDPMPRGDEDIHDQAVLALSQDSLTSHYTWEVEVDEGVISLGGRVPSVDDAEHATWMLGELPGVVDVIDNTTVDPHMP